jgi:hypothetical protein
MEGQGDLGRRSRKALTVCDWRGRDGPVRELHQPSRAIGNPTAGSVRTVDGRDAPGLAAAAGDTGGGVVSQGVPQIPAERHEPLPNLRESAKSADRCPSGPEGTTAESAENAKKGRGNRRLTNVESPMSKSGRLQTGIRPCLRPRSVENGSVAPVRPGPGNYEIRERPRKRAARGGQGTAVFSYRMIMYS